MSVILADFSRENSLKQENCLLCSKSLDWWGTCLGWGCTYLGVPPSWPGQGYLPWPGGYLPWPCGIYIRLPHPDLAGGYLPWPWGNYIGVPLPHPDLARGYLPWLGGTYLGWGVPTLGYPILTWPGVPTLGYPPARAGTPPSGQGRCTPQPGLVPPRWVWTDKQNETITFPILRMRAVKILPLT